MLFNKNNAVQKNWRMVKKGKQIVFGCTLFFAGGLALAAPAQASDQTAKAEATAVVAADNSASQGDTTSKEVESTQPKVESKETATPKETSATEKAVVSEKVVVDKSKLESILLQAKELKLVGKSSEAVAELEKAIKEAELLLTKENVTQEEINSSVADLTKVLDKVKAEKATSAIDKKSVEGEKASTSNKEATSEVATPTAKKEAVLESRTEPTAVSESTTQSETASTTSSSNPSDENTSPSVVNEKPTTTRVRSRRALSEGSVRSVDENNLQRAVVTKENFESFFQEGGTASYDESTGTIKLTEDVSGQVGSAYLRFKINPNEDFTFTGKVDIGNKYEGHRVNGRDGGDGVGFVFHTGNVDTIGQSGASIGMGTIKNAFGFKLDSWHNTSNPNASDNAPADPKYGGNAWRSNAFGAFYSSNAAGRVATVGDAKPLNPNPNGQWVDFKIEYKGQSKEFIVTYGYEKWSTNLKTANGSIMAPSAKTALNNSNATYALSFLGSTGSGTNLQRVQIEKFEFTAPQIVHVKYVDEQGNELASNTAVPGERNEVVNLNNIKSLQKTITQLQAKGYKLKTVDNNKADRYNAGNNTVTLREGGQLLKYVFAPDIKEPALTPVNNITNLTADEKTKVKAAVEAANPGAEATVGADGTTTVSYPGGASGTIPGNKTVKASQSSEIQAPTTKTPVKNLTALTTAEKQAVEAAIKAANPKATTVVVGNDGSATVTFQDGTTAPLTGAQTVKAADANGIKAPTTKTPVKNLTALTTAEKQAVEAAIKAANPKATTVVVGNDGSATVTFQDGTTAPLTGAQTVKAADANGIKAPTTKTPVKNLTALTTAEKQAVEAAIKAANPKATTVVVGNDGSATVTFQDGTTAPLTGAQTVKAADANGIKAPTTKTPVKNLTALTTAEKQAVEAAIKAANPKATTVVVGNDGSATVTFQDGTTAPLTGAQTVKAADANGIKAPTTKTPVKNLTALTTAEKQAVEAAIKAANPKATTVVVGNDGSATVTFQDGTTAPLTGAQTVKAADANGIKAPTTKTPVKNLTALTTAEKQAVEAAIKAANPKATTVVVGNDGSATVTFQDGTTAPLTGAQTVKAADANGIKAPTTKTPVKNLTALTTAEKQAVEAAIKAANPKATTVVVGNDGSATVTFQDGTTAPLTGAQTVKAADANGVQAPAKPVPVKNTGALTEAEKTAVKDAVKAVNPGTEVAVGDNGETTVTFPDGSTATLTPGQTVKAADANGVQAPAKPVPVKNTGALTEAEKTAVKDAVKAVNPGTEVAVGDNGETTVTFPDGSTATLTPGQTVKAADANGVQAPAKPVPVKNTGALTEAEKTAVKDAVKAVNPGTEVAVGDNGETTVTFPDGSTATLTPGQTVKVADANGVQAPAKPVPVKNTGALTEAEKTAVKDAVKAVNPGTEVAVGDNGETTVTFPDGSTATLTPGQTVKAADANGVQAPAKPVPVKNTGALTEAEKTAVKDAVKAVNPGTEVAVGDNGETTVTFPDGSTATLTPGQTVKAADANGVQAPAKPVPVKNTGALTEAEKTAVKDAVKAVNPGTEVAVGDNGETTVTFPDGSTATLTPGQTVKAADANGVQAPAKPVPVKNTGALTEAEKTAVKDAVKAVNPGTEVAVGDNGETTVTFPDGSTATLTPGQTVKAADANGVQAPAKPVPVKNTGALTEAEKTAVKDAVKAVNPGTEVAVGDNGETTVTFPDGSTATLTPGQTVKVADANGVQAPAKPVPVKNTGALTEAEKTAVKDAVKAVNPGTEVAVGDNGETTVTFPDGSTATLTPGQTVKAADANGVQAPATYTTVKDLTNLTDKEKEKVAEEVKKANPTATKVEVGADGTTTVTFPDGSTATLTSDKTIQVVENGEIPDPVELPLLIVTTWVDESGNELKPAVGQVSTTLDDTYQAPEHGEISGYVYVRTETNANNGTVVHIFRKVSVDNGGTQPQPQPQPNPGVPSDNVVVPTEKPQVKDPENLTPSEKEKIKEEVEKANPGKLVVVDEKGNVTVTDPRTGNSVTIPATQLVVKQQPNSVEQAKSTSTKAKRRLAATGLNSTESASLGFVALLAGIALAVRRRKDEE